MYVSSFVGRYLEVLAQKDEAARPKVQPQPQLTPQPAATPSNTAIYKGATLTLKDVVHNADECVYYVEVEDPGYLDGVLTTEIVSPLGEAEPGSVSSSSGFAIAASDVSPSYQSSSVPLPASRKSKGTRLYLRNTKKK